MINTVFSPPSITHTHTHRNSDLTSTVFGVFLFFSSFFLSFFLTPLTSRHQLRICRGSVRQNNGPTCTYTDDLPFISFSLFFFFSRCFAFLPFLFSFFFIYRRHALLSIFFFLLPEFVDSTYRSICI